VSKEDGVPQSKKRGDDKKKKILGRKTCQSCKHNNFNDGKFEFTEERNFDKEGAKKSYIVLDVKDKHQYRELRVRDLSVQELCIGRIILHSIMMLTVIFSTNQETEIFNLLKGKTKVQSDLYKDSLSETLSYIGKTLTYDWKTLKKIWCVNDDKILQILQQIILGIVKENSKFRYDKNQTPEWRDSIETSFKQICQEILKDRNQFFKNNLNPNIKGE
jgi:hypothetical protein